jgi:G:T/U-mismatch repair DNA glycosylase
MSGGIDMPCHKIQMTVDGDTFYTLEDILPETNKELKILYIAKVPAPISVEAGHYFQGRQGAAFWNKLKNYNILNIPNGDKEDDHLLEHDYGIMDIVKKPRQFGNEPTEYEYLKGMDKIIAAIQKYKPKILIFVYKGVLDKILRLRFNIHKSSVYGFNDNLNSNFYGSRVYVFPMPGTHINAVEIHRSMLELKEYIMRLGNILYPNC